MQRRYMMGALAVIIAAALAAFVMICCGPADRGMHARASEDYFAAGAASKAPEVAWARKPDSGIDGGIVTSAGDVYLWYMIDAHVLKYNGSGKLLWNKRFAPSGRKSWSYLLSNPKGELFLSQHIGQECLFSRLLPNGTLASPVRMPRSKALVLGLAAVDALGGWVSIERLSPPSGMKLVPATQQGQKTASQEYLSRYSLGGKREWSTFLQDVSVSPNPYAASSSPRFLGLVVDAKANSYLLQKSIKITDADQGSFVVDGKLMKFNQDGKRAWSVNTPSSAIPVIAMVVDLAGNTYLAGQHDHMGYYIAKHDTDGNQVWLRQPITKTDNVATRLAIDKAGNVYIAGTTSGADGTGTLYAFVAKHDPSGKLLWLKALPQMALVMGLAVDGEAVYVFGQARESGQMPAELRLMRLGK